MAKEYHKNPRNITQGELDMIHDNLIELGDISCIVHDLNSDEIIGGNQRSKIIDFNNCKIEITEEFKKPDKQGTVAWGYVVWKGMKLLYREVRWTPEQCEKANITANSLTGKWNEELLKSDEWKNVPGIENWNLPFIFDDPSLIGGKIDETVRTSNKYHDIKPLIFISFNLVQRQIEVPEEEAKQFLNAIIDLTKRGDKSLQEFFDEVYRQSFDLAQQKLNMPKDEILGN